MEVQVRRYLFGKANWFIKNNQIKIINETDYSIRLKVRIEEVVVKYHNHQLIWLCTCKQGSTKKTCSHILAAMVYLTLNLEELK